ncbi:50S ribosomal protein L27 [Candidatus Peribacteria bacterium]|jgi:large subunit ribosomal protein L27|nr:50S ribosomal protein L27 [Candidatus Peribacteria bacterium]MBT4020810.1 50S ribosomal protein L27 [Candidatus Peribacteria bacterium]MBT4241020.1 50S ribosomal protein L27 [Candidatus Peribacteria bacterium]MBT4474482.1 50S ribosomal protein L27 [Candidatus Peribacteria bacterium]
MAHKKAGGSTSNVRDSEGRRLGVKLFGGQKVNSGGIIIRQRGTKFRPGKNTYCGKDHSLHALIAGVVRFSKKQVTKFDGSKRKCTVVSVG